VNEPPTHQGRILHKDQVSGPFWGINEAEGLAPCNRVAYQQLGLGMIRTSELARVQGCARSVGSGTKRLFQGPYLMSLKWVSPLTNQGQLT
jgi:hypothetical protein